MKPKLGRVRLARLLEGKIIAFEGLDGTGKSTQAAKLVKYLRSKRIYPVAVRQPEGETDLGKTIRSLLLDKNNPDLTPLTELTLHAFSHSIQYRDVIWPAFKEGKTIIMDRCFLSAVAYQGARGLDKELILQFEFFATRLLFPHLIFLFYSEKDLSPFSTKQDRMDVEGAVYKAKVLENYLDWAKKRNVIKILVDNKTEDEILMEVVTKMEAYFLGE